MKPLIAITFAGIAVGLAAWFAIYAAIDILGWFLVWGDNGPPKWLNTMPVHAVGFGSLGLVGGILGWQLIRRRLPRVAPTLGRE